MMQVEIFKQNTAISSNQAALMMQEANLKMQFPLSPNPVSNNGWIWFNRIIEIQVDKTLVPQCYERPAWPSRRKTLQEDSETLSPIYL